MFAGIGGFREGLTRAGDFVCVGHCEIDKHADRSYRALFDMEGEWFLDDIRKADPADLPDFEAITAIAHKHHLPVIVDPSHAAGEAALVPPLALAAVAAGADGLLIEVHDRPAAALSDAAQSLSCTAFAELAEKIKKVREAIEA